MRERARAFPWFAFGILWIFRNQPERKLALVLAGFGCSLLGVNAPAQQITGSIRGTVLDPSGRTVANARVTAIQRETGFARTVTSDSEGAFFIVELPVGRYRISAEANGFQRFVLENLSLDVNDVRTLIVRLAVGTATTEVNVQADAPLIETTSSHLGKTVGEREILDLPLNGRDFFQLGLLQPGVVPLTPGLQQAGGSLRNGQAYAVNGQRPESNNFLIDGANNFNGVDGGFVINPPVDAIAEFRILTHTADAEFGHSSGSTTNVITRSGTNALHGAVWEFLRNDAMDAKSFFAASTEPLKRNQFGGTFGGPIRRNKTFFFGYYEGLRNRQGETTRTTVPSAAERQGDFGELCTSRVDASGQPDHFDGSGNCVTAGGAPDPNGQLLNLFAGPPPQPVPFNALRGVNPLSRTLLQFYPAANDGATGFIATQTLAQNNDQFGVRLDHYLGPSDALNFRYVFSQGNQLDPLSLSGANVPGFPVGEDHRAQNFVAQETHTFSSSVTAQARFSFLRNRFLFGERENHTTPASLGFQYTPSLDLAVGPPFIQVAGFASIGDPITGPRNTYESTLDFSGSVTWVRGAHALKFGGGFEHDHINVLQGIATNGFFVFAPAPFTNAMANFIVGQPVVFLQGGGDLPRGLNGKSLNLHAQDSWKATRRLTLNAGVRYDLPFPYTEIRNRQNLWEPGVQSKVFPSAPPGLLYPGDPGVPAGLIPAQKTGFAPRLGLAWDPTGKAEWVVSAAYGIFHDPYYTGQGGPLQTPISAPPFLQTPQVSFPNFADPFNGANPFNLSFAQPMTLLTLSPDLRLPYAQDWNLGVQKSFGADWLAQATYVGTKGTKLPRFIEANPAVFIPGQSSENNVNQRRLFSGCTLDPASPPCNYASVGEIAGIANSSYNALELSLKKQARSGMTFLGSYTLSKTIDDVSSFNITGSAAQSFAGENDLAQNPFDLAAERGRSMFDARHRFVFSYEWNLPFWHRGNNWYQYALGNWQINGIVTYMSGTPFTVYDSNDVSLQGQAPEISGFSSNRPNLIGNPNAGSHTVQQWFNVAAFQQLDPVANAGQFGNEGRNVVEGPGLANWDFSALKNFRISEGKNLQFRAEFFNVFNHPNFRLPNNDISSPSFGQIQGALDGRLVQLALKFTY